MSKLIQLTNAQNNKRIYVNTRHIKAIMQPNEKDWTVLHMTGKENIAVKETIDDVVININTAKIII